MCEFLCMLLLKEKEGILILYSALEDRYIFKINISLKLIQGEENLLHVELIASGNLNSPDRYNYIVKMKHILWKIQSVSS